MARRKLEDLNLLDDFLFGSMVTHPDIGEKFVRELLKIIFGRDFGKLTVVPQKIYYGTDTDMHGARLDVYLEENPSAKEEEAVVYDVEPDKNSGTKEIEVLPRRVRFYHAKIDGDSLKSGESYEKLKNVIVILITPYDPFGLNRMVYTVRNMCEEVPSMPYDDGARTIFLYTRGTQGDPPKELRQLLHYMEHTTEENASNDNLKILNQMVDRVKHDREVSLNYMKVAEWEEMLIKQGREEEKANTERERQRVEEEKANAERERMRAEKEKANTERERLRAEAEKARADQAEEELKRLKEQLALSENIDIK